MSFSGGFADIPAHSYPVLSAQQHDEVPKQTGRVSVQEVVIPGTLQGFVLGELYHVHLMGLLSDGTEM